MNADLLDPNLPLSKLGEGAFWHNASSTLYWVDIEGRMVHSYDTCARTHRSWQVSQQVSFVFPADEEGHLLLGMSDGVYDFDLATRVETAIATLDLPSQHRLNDGKLDPSGRLWGGTINTSQEPSETAALYVLRDGVLEEVEGGYVNANGKTWSPDGKIIYHADTHRGAIWMYDYDGEAGTISNRRVFVRKDDWHPDGLSSDREGRVLVAVYGGACVEIYSHRGDLIDKVDVPALNVTSCALGPEGALFITTAYAGMEDADRQRSPLSGAVFTAKLI
ncbi:sugar lactone lactonase YvrE [Neorhizobium sp. 2083]|uniref:SMP-30/gluconolactonase/LRE family protein n=1 Tax=Neorhizobium sp. 2083 TaxID=2817762 RepID=UPI00285618C9|nr:SMP-30/gluconolactonase/LRE family protein [Neorhizobium sp. 2083]MDR6820788.1 sugar lactone lactonase YvrE [Neorhizobium sp. 2083]